MSLLERRELGTLGLAYIRERLTGGRTLTRYLLEQVDLASGHAWAYLPTSMNDEQAARFDEFGLTELATEQHRVLTKRPEYHSELPAFFQGAEVLWEMVGNVITPLIVEQLQTFLSTHEHSVALWEAPNLKPGDPWVLAHPDKPLYFVGEEVYYVFMHHTATREAIADGLHGLNAWYGSPAVLAVVSVEELSPFQTPLATVDAERMRPLVSNPDLLFFEAYDAEGYVCWSPTTFDETHHSNDQVVHSADQPRRELLPQCDI